MSEIINTFSITMNAVQEWTVSKDSSWITLNKTSGTGSDTIIVSVSENTGTVRTGHITVTLADASIAKTCTVTQTAKSETYYLTFTPNTFSVTSGIQNKTTTVTSNTSWELYNTTGNIFVTADKSSGTGNTTIVYSIDSNTTADAREVVYHYRTTNGLITAEVTISQAGEGQTNYLFLDKDAENINNGAGTTILEVSSNVFFTVSSDSPSWLLSTPTFGNGNYNLTIGWNANTTSSSRTGIITVSSTVGSIVRTFTVTQAAGAVEDHLYFSPTSATLPAVIDGTYSANLYASEGLHWKISSSQSWLFPSPSSGTGDATIYLSNSSNNSPSSRSGTLTAIDDDGSLSAVFTVTQNGVESSSAVFNPTVSNYTSSSQTFYVEVNANTDWTIATSSPWITNLTPTTGSSGTTQVYMTISANTEAVSFREGVVTVYFSGGSNTFTVRQAGQGYLIVNPTSVVLSSLSGQSSTILVDASVGTSQATPSFSVSTLPSWLTLSNQTSDQFTITTNEQNSLKDSRSATLTVSNLSQPEVSSKTVYVQQQGSITSYYLYLSQNSLNTNSAAGSIGIVPITNTSWNAVSNTASWLTVTPASGSSGANSTVSWTANTTGSSRSAVITYQNISYDLYATFTVTQSAEVVVSTLELDQEVYNTSNVSGSLTLGVTSNTSWSVTSLASWLTPSITSGTGNETIGVSWTTNTLSGERLGQILVQTTDGLITKALTVTQAGQTNYYIQIGPNSEIGSSGGTINLDVTSNVAWTIEISGAAGATASPTSGTNNGITTITVPTNTNISSRTYVIKAVNTQHNLIASCIITQSSSGIINKTATADMTVTSTESIAGLPVRAYIDVYFMSTYFSPSSFSWAAIPAGVQPTQELIVEYPQTFEETWLDIFATEDSGNFQLVDITIVNTQMGVNNTYTIENGGNQLEVKIPLELPDPSHWNFTVHFHN